MTAQPAADRVLILDFGSQVTQLIARRVRESGVYCEIMPFNADPARIARIRARARSSSPAGRPAPPSRTARARRRRSSSAACRCWAICYGTQAMCVQLGGEVQPSAVREYGRAFAEITDDCALFEGIWEKGRREQVWMSHGDVLTRLPPGFRRVAVTDDAPLAAIADDARRFYGLLFHPEVVHTPHGAQLLRNFTHHVAGCRGDWTMAGFRAMQIGPHPRAGRRRAGDLRIVGRRRFVGRRGAGARGGGRCAHLHLRRSRPAARGRSRGGGAHCFATASTSGSCIATPRRGSSRALAGVTDPEIKRKTIGRLFIEVFEEEAEKIGGADFLAQGTLYPDVIESVSATGGPSVTIKSHHNVGGLPERMRMALVEPLRELFKDEVRALGRELGIPEAIVGRHPFPGPGLAIRIPGAVTPERLDLLRRADAIFLEEIRSAGLYDAIWQAFAVLLPVRTVGVMGDGRSYDVACALRAVTSTDGMTAEFYPFDAGFLGGVANRIVNEVRGINRVTYDITSKPPGTIEWE